MVVTRVGLIADAIGFTPVGVAISPLIACARMRIALAIVGIVRWFGVDRHLGRPSGPWWDGTEEHSARVAAVANH